eukprot:TRINITY_DN1894_c0_g1_i2.p1 TRINITY_DN1894_c0_g1~~TRINITY_DN1894_c0_g1_i2.p1  ORF type:complete len:462 (-),score=159.70 TRINITY_DN1894_c0_g1_i2:60-1445(-)
MSDKDKKKKEKEKEKEAKAAAKAAAKAKKSKRANPVATNLFAFDVHGEAIPIIVEQCIQYLEKDGYNQEGIFRLSGSSTEMERLKHLYMEGKTVDLKKEAREPNDVAGLLKLYFREMSDPLLTWELYECFLAAVGVPSSDARNDCLRKVLDLLPFVNRLVLAKLMGLLHKVSLHSTTNKMNSHNLAIVFSPTLYRPKEETMEVVMQDASHAVSLIETFITNCEELFEGKKKSEEPVQVDEQTMNGFRKKVRGGTIRLAKKFLEQEKSTSIVSAEEGDSIFKPPDSVEPSTATPAINIQSSTAPSSPAPSSPVLTHEKSNSAPSSANNSFIEENPSEIEKLRSMSVAPRPVVIPNAFRGAMDTGTGVVNRPTVYSKPPVPSRPPPRPLGTPSTNAPTTPPPSAPSTSPPASTGEEETISAKSLVDKLLEGKNVFVMNYLDTLDVSKRKGIVDEMSVILQQAA